jgi:hypothetical protein
MITVNGIATFEEDITIKKNSTLGTDSSSLITVNGIATFDSTPIFNKGIGLSSNTLTIPTENMIGYKLTSSISSAEGVYGSGNLPGTYFNYLYLDGPIGSIWNVCTSFYYAGFSDIFFNGKSIICILISNLQTIDIINYPFENTEPTENYIGHNFISLNTTEQPRMTNTAFGCASGYYTILNDMHTVYAGIQFILEEGINTQRQFYYSENDPNIYNLRTHITAVRIA